MRYRRFTYRYMEVTTPVGESSLGDRWPENLPVGRRFFQPPAEPVEMPAGWVPTTEQGALELAEWQKVYAALERVLTLSLQQFQIV